MSTLWDGLFCKVLAKYSLTLDSSASNMCFSRVLFAGTFLANFLQASRETTIIFIVCLILHQLNTKSIPISMCKVMQNEKVTDFTHFEQKNTHISRCKIVHKCTIATEIVHIRTITVACAFNILLFFLSPPHSLFFSLVWLSTSFRFPLFPSDHINSAKKKKTNRKTPTQHNPTITTAT